MIKVIFKSSTSVCCEWDNNLAYNTKQDYSIQCNGNIVFSGNTNVFSLFDLCPDTQYTLVETVGGDTVTFVTDSETCCVSVKQFGAKGDGVADDTIAVQSAINTCARGGRIVVEKGIYNVGPILLKSNITVQIDQGAVLLGLTDMDKYPILPGELTDYYNSEMVQISTWEGNPVSAHQSLVGGWHLDNIKIVGRGTIDGNAHNGAWWHNVKELPHGRPRLLFLNKCCNVKVHGITGQNAASWQFHPYFSSDIGFFDMTINAPQDSPNTDAIDPESCDKVDIVGCKFSVGDDCIAIKAGKIYMGAKYKTPASRHTIRNCLMQFGHGAVVLGSEMAGGVKDLTVNRCKFFSTDRGLRIKTRRGRGEDAVIDGVLFENIVMDNVLCPIVINMYYNCCDPDRFSEYVWSREHLPIDERTPYLGEFVFKDIICTNTHYAAAYCDGLPEQPIASITVENVHFTYSPKAKSGLPAMRSFIEPFCKAGMYFDNIGKLKVNNVTFEGVEGEPITANHVKTIQGV